MVVVAELGGGRFSEHLNSLHVMWQLEWEQSLGEDGYKCIYD